MKHSLLSLVLIPVFLTACTADISQTPGDSDASGSSQVSSLMPSDMVQYGTLGDTALHGYLARPNGDGKHPALILIHEWWGLNDNIKELAERFADEGYIALAVDLYEGRSTEDQVEAQKLMGTVRDNPTRALDNLKQAVAYLKTRSDVDPTLLASVGWCFGGGWSYQMAKNDLGVKATVMYYGQFDPEDDFAHMKSHIIGHFGEKDTSIKVDDVKEFQASLKTANGDHEVYIYPNAGHAFANEEGANYNEEAASLAWDRTLAFLTKVMNSDAQSSGSSMSK